MVRIRNYLGRNLSKKREEDKLSADQRSLLMSKISSRGTKLEKNFILALKKNTRNKFIINSREIRGTPDIVFFEEKLCIFLDSDFWHGWQYPRWKHLLKNHAWRNKLERNRARDKKNNLYLRNQGWKVIRIWEHDIKKDSSKVIDRVLNALR